MAETVIFAEQTLEGFAYSSGFGAYHKMVTPAPFALEEGQSYVVSWDGASATKETFAYTYTDGAVCVAVGNQIILGTDTGEPYCIVYDATNDLVHFFATDDADSHTVAIHQAADDSTGGETEESGPADAVILNYSQDPVIYKDIPKVWLTHADSPEEDVSLIPFTYGEAVSKTVVPDCAAGDMDVPIAAGELVKVLIVERLEDRIPGNAREG